MDTCALEALLGNINTAGTGRLLQHADVVLAELGQIVGNESSLALELLVALGIQDFDAVGGEIEDNAEVVPAE